MRCLLLKAGKSFEQALERDVMTPEIPFYSKQDEFISREEYFVLRLTARQGSRLSTWSQAKKIASTR